MDDEPQRFADGRSPAADEPNPVFQELVAAWESGCEPALAPYLERAGPRAAQLERLAELLRGLVEIGAYAHVADVEELAVPTVLGRYRVIGLLGQGGQSRVVLAEDVELERRVALKVITDARFLTRESRDWIKNEGQVIARLSHPGVVRVLDIGEAEGLPFLVMELVDGPNLKEVVDALAELERGQDLARHSERALTAAAGLASLGARARLALRLARALAACHGEGVLHRDLKPSNVLLERGREPKLVDFGLGNLGVREQSLTNVTVTFVGTAAHLSPEQVEKRRTLAEPASDQFALGSLLYELFTLTSPFARETESETLAAVAAANPVAPRKLEPKIPLDLERIVLTALGRTPADRYPSVEALADDLEAFLDHRAIQARPPSLGRRALLWSKRRRKTFLLSVATLSALFGLGVVKPFVEERNQRSDLLARLDTFVERTRATQDANDFERAFGALDQLESEVRNHRSSLFDPVLRDLAEPLEAARDTLCTAVARGFERAYEHAQDGIESFQAEARRVLVGRWAGVRSLSNSRCGESVELLHSVGTVSFAPHAGQLELYQYKHGRFMSAELVGVSEVSERETGLYRVRWLDDAGRLTAEADFQVDPGAPRLELSPRLPSRVWLAAMREVEVEGLPRETCPTGSLLVLPRVLRDPERTTHLPVGADATDEFASTSLPEALELARVLGLRLPTEAELTALLSSGAVEPARPLLGEWCLSASPILLRYSTDPDKRAPAGNRLVEFPDRAQGEYGLRFVCDPRLAR